MKNHYVINLHDIVDVLDYSIETASWKALNLRTWQSISLTPETPPV